MIAAATARTGPHLGQAHPHQACHIVAVLIKFLAGLHLLLNELGHAHTHAVGDFGDHLQAAAQLQSRGMLSASTSFGCTICRGQQGSQARAPHCTAAASELSNDLVW